MLRGTFDTDGRPYMEGHLLIPRLRIASKVSFLVDTGAVLYSPTDDSLTFQVKNADQIVPTSRPGS